MLSQSAALMDEADWIRLARQGDEAAWEVLIKNHQEAVFRLAYLLLGDADDAQDVAQDTFIRAYRSLNRFDLQRPLRPWLLRICANLAHNRQRSIGRYLTALKRFANEQPQATDKSGEHNLEKWGLQSVWKAIHKLKPRDQEIIYMRFFLEMPVEETAMAMEIAPGTVKSRLHRAVEHLRAIIEKSFPELKDLAI